MRRSWGSAGLLLAAIALTLGGCQGVAVTPAPSAPTSVPITQPTATASEAPTSVAPSSVAPTSAAPTSAAPTSVAPTTTKPTTTKPTSAACAIPASLRGKDFTAIPTTRKVIALTFDGGSTSDGTSSILATLKAKGVPATFFLTGDFADAYPTTSKTIAASYPIGNHTQNHPDLTTLSDAAALADIDEGRRSIIDATGVDPKPYFRFPFGAVDARRITLVNNACYVPFRWTTDTLGWKGTSGGQSAASVTKRVLDGAKPGGIVLLHLGSNPDDHSTLDADALPGIIEGLKAKGYSFVTLEAALPAAP